VPEFWRFPEQRALVADVVQWAAVEWLLPPKTESRRYALSFPMTGLIRHQVRVDFPEDVWTQPTSQRSDDGDAHFNVSIHAEGTRRSAEYTADVRILADRVEPAQWQAFSVQLNKQLPRLAATVAVPAMAQAAMQRLSSDSKTLEEAMRSKRVKALTALQVQSQYRALGLQAQIDAGRLSSPLKAQALVARGVALDQTGRTDEAQKDFEAALALEPESVEALNGAAVNALSRGDMARAVSLAAQVLKLRPRDGAALNTRAIAQHFAGQWPQAQADWQASLNDRAAQRRGYPLLWLALATRRAGADMGALLQSYPRENWPTEWPRPLLDAAFLPKATSHVPANNGARWWTWVWWSSWSMARHASVCWPRAEDRRACGKRSAPTRQFRVQQVPQPITHQVQAQHAQHDRHTGINGQQRGLEHQRLCVVQHAAPAWLWRLGAQAQVTQRRLGQDGGGK
jgi:tetratricopeptide (TPR) repeat protein